MANKVRCRVVQKHLGGSYKQKMDNVRRLVEIFKKTVKASGVTTEYKRHQYYEKPSEKRRRKKMEAMERARKQQTEVERWRTRFG